MKIEWLPGAVFDLQRLREFILPHNADAARRAVSVTRKAVSMLHTNMFIGKPVEDMPDFRDMVIPFGSSGYLLRYRIEIDTVLIVAVKHGKEAGFFSPDEVSRTL
jgi:plasmid stabilization system protein ParE